MSGSDAELMRQAFGSPDDNAATARMAKALSEPLSTTVETEEGKQHTADWEPCPLAAALGPEWTWTPLASGAVTLTHDSWLYTEASRTVAETDDAEALALIAGALGGAVFAGITGQVNIISTRDDLDDGTHRLSSWAEEHEEQWQPADVDSPFFKAGTVPKGMGIIGGGKRWRALRREDRGGVPGYAVHRVVDYSECTVVSHEPLVCEHCGNALAEQHLMGCALLKGPVFELLVLDPAGVSDWPDEKLLARHVALMVEAAECLRTDTEPSKLSADVARRVEDALEGRGYLWSEKENGWVWPTAALLTALGQGWRIEVSSSVELVHDSGLWWSLPKTEPPEPLPPFSVEVDVDDIFDMVLAGALHAAVEAGIVGSVRVEVESEPARQGVRPWKMSSWVEHGDGLKGPVFECCPELPEIEDVNDQLVPTHVGQPRPVPE